MLETGLEDAAPPLSPCRYGVQGLAGKLVRSVAVEDAIVLLQSAWIEKTSRHSTQTWSIHRRRGNSRSLD